ncbi:MAG: non-ribosomal peptide synthetase [Pyrinomonadaceae bacterium]
MQNQNTAADAGIANPVIADENQAFVFPMSPAQTRFWFLDQLRPGTSALNLPIALEADGEIDEFVLEQSLRQILMRHEVLRSAFGMFENQPVQIVASMVDFELQVIDLSMLDDDECQRQLDSLMGTEVRYGFDLKKGGLFRGTLFRISDTKSLLLLNMHHSVADGWSYGVILRELEAWYAAISNGTEPQLPELPIQYGDYAGWQLESLASPEFQSKLSFWRKTLSGAPRFLDLPIAKARPKKPSLEAMIRSQLLDAPLTKATKELSVRHGTTPFMTLMAAFKILLFRLAGQNDIVVGSPVANRTLPEIEHLIGCFVNTVIFRTQLTGELTFGEVLAKVRDYSVEIYAYQDVPIDAIVEDLQPERTLDRNPLFQILFVQQKAFIQPFRVPGVSFTPVQVDRKGTQTDMTFFLIEREEGLRLSCEYRKDLFDQPSIDRLLGQYNALLKNIVTDVNTPIEMLSILAPEERQVSTEIQSSIAPTQQTECLHQLFEAQVQRHPDAVALVFEGQSLTYRELNRRANVLAKMLRDKGVSSESLVGICLERSMEMIISILGVLKAGAAYVPLDPAYPDERLQFILNDSQTRIVIAEKGLEDRIRPLSKQLRVINPETATGYVNSDENIDSVNSPDDLAYVIYTSGSTGTPKGVTVSHRNVARLMSSTQQWFDFGASDVWTLFHSFAFDFSVWELWGALAYGGRLVVVPYEISRDPKEFYDVLCEQGVTVLNQTPSAFRALIRAEESVSLRKDLALRFVIFGGEALDFKSLQPWVDRHGTTSPKLINMYGITETTVHVTYREISEADIKTGAGSIIGRAIPDLKLYILDEQMQPVPEGTTGEMYVAGPGLARGYLNRPELTAERFIADPFDEENDSRLYRTGDLARYLTNGEVEYLGRIDNQVKIRGFRIELGEIEAAISQFEDVSEAVVTARQESDDDKKLVAYLLSKSASKIEQAELRTFLKKKLPNYMVPSAFVQLEKLPLTANGKIDFDALPPPEMHISQEREGFEPPKTDTEKSLAKIWSNVLGVENVGLHDNFFDLGGHSLLAIHLFAAVEETFHKSIPLATLFEAGTVYELAEMLNVSDWQEPDSSIVPIQPNGSKSPLFCMHAGGGNVLFYRDLAKHLGSEQPLYGVQARRIGGRQVTHDTVEEMAEFYISEIKKVQPEGPYYLSGSSFGGLLSLEIAQKLNQNGEEIGLLALFDTGSPTYPKLLKETTPLRRRLYRYARRFQHHRDSLAGLNGKERIDYVVNRVKKVQLKYRRNCRDAYLKLVRLFYFKYRNEKLLPTQYIKLEDKILKANARYRPQKYPGKMTLFRAKNQPLGIVPDLTLGWAGIPAELEIHEVAGHHGSLVAEPYVRKLAENLSECIQSVQLQRNYSDKVSSTKTNSVEFSSQEIATLSSSKAGALSTN